MIADVHGLAVSHDTELDDDPLTPFFSAFPAVVRAPEVVVRVRRATPTRPAGRPLYFLGAVQVYAEPDGYSLFDGDARGDVSAEGGQVSVAAPCAPQPFLGGLMHAALLLALRLRGWVELHAAGLMLGERAALLVGDAGVGKTTALFSCVERGARFLSDDRVLLRGPDRVLAYPREAHLAEATVAALPSLRDVPLAGPVLGGKRRGDVRARWPERFVASSPRPAALVFPRLASEPTRLLPLAPADALGGLIEASALVAVAEVPLATENLALLARLADAVPAWSLELGPDALRDPGVVHAAVSRAAS